MEKSELSKIFTAVMDKSIVNNLSHTAEEIKIVMSDKKLTTYKKAELLECNIKLDEFIQKYSNKDFAVLSSDTYIQEYSGIQNMVSRQSPGRRFFLVPWIHPILSTVRFSKWAPAKNVTAADLSILERKSNELAVAHIKPKEESITLVNVPKSEGKIAVDNSNKSPQIQSREILEDSDSDFSDKLDLEYLQKLDLSFETSENSSSGCRIHSSSSSGIDDSGLGDSQSAIKEENEINHQLNQTAPAIPSAAERRNAFAAKTGNGFKTIQHHSLDERPTSTPRGRGRGRTRGLRGRRGRRLTK